MGSVDVFIPCYNYGRFLKQCVESVLSQNHVEFRVLIIDDASTDNSAEIAKKLALRDKRIQLHLHERNRGHIFTYNEGIEWAQADYMLLLSADDFLSQGALYRAVSVMEADSTIGFVYGRAIRFTSDSNDVSRTPIDIDARLTTIDGIEFIKKFCFNPVNPIDTATAVVRTALQKEIGGYRPELPHSGDLEMWLRFAANANVCEINAVQAYTRLHGENMRNIYEKDMFIGDYKQKYEAFKMFFQYTAQNREIQNLRAIAYRAIAEDAVWKATIAFENGSCSNIKPMLEFAKATYPDIVKAPVWWKLLVKRGLGARLWASVAPLVQKLRGLLPMRSLQ